MVEILFRPLLSKQRLLCSIQAEVGRLLPFVLALLRGTISISNIRKVMGGYGTCLTRSQILTVTLMQYCVGPPLCGRPLWMAAEPREKLPLRLTAGELPIRSDCLQPTKIQNQKSP